MAAPRTALNTGNGTPAAPDFDWEGVGAPPSPRWFWDSFAGSHLYPGDVAWTEEGHRFAWHMRLKDKVGAARFLVRFAGGRSSSRWILPLGDVSTEPSITSRRPAPGS